jgi:hypothetical protein
MHEHRMAYRGNRFRCRGDGHGGRRRAGVPFTEPSLIWVFFSVPDAMRWHVHASTSPKCAVRDAFTGSSPASVMPGLSMRSSCAALWLTLVLLHDALVHPVHAATLETHPNYQACLASPSTCTALCASLLTLEGVFEVATPQKVSRFGASERRRAFTP